MKIILIMGLPGSGKTTLANELANSFAKVVLPDPGSPIIKIIFIINY